jgi:hypothetical protein
MPPHVPIGVGFRRWRGKVKRRVCNAGRVVGEQIRGWEKHNNNRMPCRQALLRAVGLGTKLFGLGGPIVDALPILRISME